MRFYKIALVLLISIFFSGCMFTATKEPIRFKEVGLPDESFVGQHITSKVKLGPDETDITETDLDIYLCKKDGKYHFTIISTYKELIGVYSGNGIPSKVDGTDDYYIISFPKFKITNYHLKRKVKEKTEIKNFIVSFKYKGDTLKVWTYIFGDLSKVSPKKAKEIIKSSYKLTETAKPSFIFKAKSREKCFRDNLDIAESIDKRYSDFKLK